MPDFVRPLNLKKPIVNRKLIAWGFILTGLISIGSWFVGRSNRDVPEGENNVTAAEGNSWWGPVKITYTITPPTPTPLGQAVISQLQPQIASASGVYGIYVYRLTTHAGYGIGADSTMPAASIMKVPMMVATYRQVEAGKIKLEDVQELMEAMGKRSDNSAVQVLINKIGREFMRQTVKDLGMSHTDFDANTTTAYDLGVMWKNLYEGKLIQSPHWLQMQDFLTDSIFEERISAGVPEDIKVVHKVGTDLDIWADSGIVMSPKPFIITILNDDVDLNEAKELYPKLVQTIYQAETAGQ